MSTVVAEIEAKIRSLSLEDKNELIRALIAELDGPSDAGVAFVFVGGPPPGRSVFSELTQCEPTSSHHRRGRDKTASEPRRFPDQAS